MSKITGALAGVVLCAGGVFAFYYSIRTARSQQIYYSLKYGAGSAAMSLEQASGAAEKARRLYPYNYELPIYICSRYLPQIRHSSADRDVTDLVRRQCDYGLSLNPYPRVLRYTKALLLADASPAEAADYWTGFVDWQFWSSRNLAILVGLYARAGRLAEASEFLGLLKGRPEYAKAAAALKQAFRREMRAP